VGNFINLGEFGVTVKADEAETGGLVSVLCGKVAAFRVWAT